MSLMKAVFLYTLKGVPTSLSFFTMLIDDWSSNATVSSSHVAVM